MIDASPASTDTKPTEQPAVGNEQPSRRAPALMNPSIGRMVHYMLTEFDADSIASRRAAVGELHHIGNYVKAGQVYPMVIVRVWGDGPTAAVNGQVFLDGTDLYWATSKQQIAAAAEDKQGHWFAPART